MASLNQGILERIELPIPPLPVQQKIAEVLSAYDELIENNQRRIRILEEMAHSLYREWFVHFRFPGHENHPRVPSSLGEIPQGWERQPVKNILARRPSGNVYHASQPELINGIPIIDQSTSELLGYHANNPDHPASEAHPLAIFGDHTCKMQILFEPFSVGPNVIPFENGIDRPLPYLFYVVRSLVQTQEYKRHWTTLCSKNVVVADKVVAEKFSDAIHPQLRKMSHLQRTNRLLRRTRDLLLPRLLSGQIELEVD